MSYDNLIVDKIYNDKVWIIKLNREKSANSIDKSTAKELEQIFNLFDKNEKSCVAILTGGNKYFCSGADLKQVNLNLAEFINSGNTYNSNMNSLSLNEAPLGISRMLLKKPVIAAISGPAVAGGFELALWCDLRVSYKDCSLGVFCRRFGVPLIDGGTFRLSKLIGLSRAMDLILTGRNVSGVEGYNIGLINKIVEKPEEVINEAIKLAEQLSDLPQICMRNDRMSLIESTFDFNIDRMIKNEFEYGIESLKSGEAVKGSKLFSEGNGKHGKSLSKPKF